MAGSVGTSTGTLHSCTLQAVPAVLEKGCRESKGPRQELRRTEHKDLATEHHFALATQHYFAIELNCCPAQQVPATAEAAKELLIRLVVPMPGELQTGLGAHSMIVD